MKVKFEESLGKDGESADWAGLLGAIGHFCSGRVDDNALMTTLVMIAMKMAMAYQHIPTMTRMIMTKRMKIMVNLMTIMVTLMVMLLMMIKMVGGWEEDWDGGGVMKIKWSVDG